MKTLTKLTKLLPILMACVLLLGLSSCCCLPDRYDDRTVFHYLNETTDFIKIIVTSTNLATNEIRYTIYNPENESQFSIVYPEYDFKYPFTISESDPTNFKTTIKIQMGDVEVIQTSSEGGSLFDIGNYKLIEQSGSTTDYEFTFTDDFFTDATPIE